MFGEYKCLLKQRVCTPNETREGCSEYGAVAKLATVRKKKKIASDFRTRKKQIL